MILTLIRLTTPPLAHTRAHSDNLLDHIDHTLMVDVIANETTRVEIEPTTERFFDEGDFSVFAFKNVGYEVLKMDLYCLTCNGPLDVPNHIEWTT